MSDRGSGSHSSDLEAGKESSITAVPDGNAPLSARVEGRTESRGSPGYKPRNPRYDESKPTSILQGPPALPMEISGDSQDPGHDQHGEARSSHPAVPGDFDSNANPLWSLYGKEVKGYDEATIQVWKEDMDGILIFAGLFSASLTAFLAESYQNLQPDPVVESAFYSRQTITILSQISQQIASLTPPGAASSVHPQFFPDFHPSPSDIRVNVFWFMSLIFSLTAALCATIVQQWVRDYMYVFQMHSDPLKRARMRQFLHEGSERWHMSAVAESVPALVHIALFLFFVGVGDFLFNINTTVAVSTMAPIAVCGSLYIWSAVASLVDPQCPYQNPFSGLCWRIYSKLQPKPGGSRRTMADVQLQLATNKLDPSLLLNRDANGIRWLIENMAEDSESAQLILSIPGAFKTEWGKTVMMHALEGDEQTVGVGSRLQELCDRVGRVVEASAFSATYTEDTRRKIAVASVESASCLVFEADGHFDWITEGRAASFSHTLSSVAQISLFRSEGFPELLPGAARLGPRWACLSLMAIRNLLSQANCRDEAWSVIAAFAQASPKVQGHDSVYFKAIQGTRYIDHLLSTRAFPVLQMLRRINERELHEARDVLIDHKNKIEELRDLSDEADRLEGLDRSISTLIQRMADSTSGLTEFLPLYHRNDPSLPPPDYFLLPGVSRADQWQVLRTSFTLPGRLLKLLSNLAVEALRVLDNKGSGDAVSRMKRLTSLLHPLVVHHQLIYMQLMRAYDHSVGGGFGHNLELFFWQVKHFSRFRPQDTLHPDAELLKMYVTVFDTLTKSCDDRARYSVGTQQLLLNITCEVLHVRVGFLSSASLPPSLIDKFIDFIRVYFQDTEANDKWITDTRKELERCKDVELRNKALRALPQPSSPQRSS